MFQLLLQLLQDVHVDSSPEAIPLGEAEQAAYRSGKLGASFLTRRALSELTRTSHHVSIATPPLSNTVVKTSVTHSNPSCSGPISHIRGQIHFYDVLLGLYHLRFVDDIVLITPRINHQLQLRTYASESWTTQNRMNTPLESRCRESRGRCSEWHDSRSERRPPYSELRQRSKI